jgi:Sugar transferases involved in lipopolysaccharide synthesis
MQQHTFSQPIRRKLFKRLFDIFFSLTILIALSPLYLLLAIFVKYSSEGPIFYTSRRIGRKGKIIDCLKFRTMEKGADDKLTDLLASDPKLAAEWALFDKLYQDPRVTPLGRFLRKTSLDELPQFFNVLTGDLSVVGPRALHIIGSPETYLKEMRRIYGDKTDQILSVRPGITGIWQISGRSFIPIEERCRLDALYVQHQTFWQDLKVICKTIPAVLHSKGAF